MREEGRGPVLDEAWRSLCARLAALGDSILGEDFPSDPRGRAEGYRALTRLLVYALQFELEAGDPQFPTFVRHQDPHNQWGGPDPNVVYLRAHVDPAFSYRVRADLQGLRHGIVSLHEGDMQLGEFGVYAEHSLDEFEAGDDGCVEIRISAREQPPNWISLHPKARILTIRIRLDDWDRDPVPRFHIVREGSEGAPPPLLDPEFVERALDRAATWVESSVVFWNRYASEAWRRATPNVPSPAAPARGGADGILYGSCAWELDDDGLLLLTCEAPEARAWGFTIHTLGWLESGDFADRQTSLNRAQLHVDADGRIRIALAHTDPGIPNWIDTEGRRRGLLVYRFVGAKTRPVPAARVVRVADLPALLPPDHPTIDTTARRRILARRRESVWGRYR